jgi:hypothetical protein
MVMVCGSGADVPCAPTTDAEASSKTDRAAVVVVRFIEKIPPYRTGMSHPGRLAGPPRSV